MKKRNGKVELLRFIFCLAVMFFHLNNDLYGNSLVFGQHLSFFARGNLSVEFFFLLSGFLMARSALKKDDSNRTLGQSTVCFLKNKYLALLPMQLIIFPVTLITSVVKDCGTVTEALKYILYSIPGFFFMQRIGFEMNPVIMPEWYIGCMLVALAILYPLCKKYRDSFTNIIAPVSSLMILGFMFHKYLSVANISVWSGVMYKCQLRAIAEVALGATAYAVSKKFSTYNFTKLDKRVLTLVELCCVAFSIFFVCSRMKLRYAYLLIFALFIALSLIFSGVTHGEKLLQNKLVMYLGKMSLPIYLSHTFTKRLVYWVFPEASSAAKILLVTAFTFAVSAIVIELAKPISRAIFNKLDALENKECV